MKYGILESFRMHNTKVNYGLTPDDDRVSLFSKARELGFQGIEFGIGLDYREDSLWTGNGNMRRAMKEAAQTTDIEAASICLHLLNYREHSPASDYVEHRETRPIWYALSKPLGLTMCRYILIPVIPLVLATI